MSDLPWIAAPPETKPRKPGEQWVEYVPKYPRECWVCKWSINPDQVGVFFFRLGVSTHKACAPHLIRMFYRKRGSDG